MAATSATPGRFLHQATAPEPVHARITLLACLGWLAVFHALIVTFQLALLYRVELGLDDAGVARIKALVLVASGAGGLLFGALADRSGRRFALLASLATYGAGACACACAPTAAWMSASATLLGLGVGGQWAAGQTLLGETVPPQLRGRLGALAQTGAPLGLGLATVMATQVAPAIGWRPVFALAALPALLLPLLARGVPESDVWRAWKQDRGPRERAGLAALLEPGVRGPFALAFVLTLLNMANYWFLVSWLPEFLGRSWHLRIQTSGLWTLVVVCGSLAGYVGFGFASDRFGRRVSFTAFCLVMAAAMATLTLAQDLLRDRPALLLAFLFAAGVGTGTWSNFGPFFAELFPTRVRNTASGICMNASRGLTAMSPILIVAVGGYDLARGVALAALFALGAAAWVWLLPETHARPLEAAEPEPRAALRV